MTWVRRTALLYKQLNVDETPLTKRRLEAFLGLAVAERLREVDLDTVLEELRQALQSDP